MKLLSIDKPPVDVLKIFYLEKFKNKETGMINPFFPYYKDIINGQSYILKLENGGTCLVPVEIIENKEDLK